MIRSALEAPIRAAKEVAGKHGVVLDRCEILQDGNTLVLRLSESLVARVVTDLEGPRKGTEWFEREIGVAKYLAESGAPVIPLHSDLPPGPYEHLGYALNFWKYVQRVDDEPRPAEVGRTLFDCHRLLRSYGKPLPEMAIPTESLDLLDSLEQRGDFPLETIALLRDRLSSSLAVLRKFPSQALHGDAHPGNLMQTTEGLLWTDWEDTFAGPIEWDLASMIWNARILDEDHASADGILSAYREAGGCIDEEALQQSLIARAAVMSAWYPVLYPGLPGDRRTKLQRRLDWLAAEGN